MSEAKPHAFPIVHTALPLGHNFMLVAAAPREWGQTNTRVLIELHVLHISDVLRHHLILLRFHHLASWLRAAKRQNHV